MENKEEKDLNLWEKINIIQTKAKEIMKSGKGNFGSYKKFSDIAQVVLGDMRDLGVTFLPTNTHLTPETMFLEIENKRVKYIQEWELRNANEPTQVQTFFFPMIGENTKGADWANGSAVTYALKYMFNIWGLIPDESLDPDAEDRSDNNKNTLKQAKTGKNKEYLDKAKQVLEIFKDKSLRDDLINGGDKTMNYLFNKKPQSLEEAYKDILDMGEANLNATLESVKVIK